MSDLQSVIQSMREVQQRLDNSSKTIFGLAKAKAESEKAYKIALRQEILTLKAAGHPATLILELAKGNEKIASLRLDRDIARETYKAGLDAMNNLRTEASLLQSILRWQNDMGS
ncbi:hypothetical protein [Shouchella lehensis]|uniref:DUF5082 domain-containing protein n=1 Tax=Shouchella lehensis TaxID=300825 RepID=A0A4Y7WIZ1_9BACI|nr:hypothetical protein [Shouchella lehensis]TES48065.1 hypothetical protein E2L03_13095 [Shouchella lehensis]